FLARAFVGYKRFSIEGTDALVPMLDTALEESAAAGAHTVAISMAHRGRLNVLTNVLGKPIEQLFSEFMGRHDHLVGTGTGDVKYHLGYNNDTETRAGRKLHVTLVPNPSHLEVVNPVLQGLARARQRNATDPYERDEFAVVPICIHGDAAFPGEGIVAETFNLAHLRGYSVGGTLHVIVNNQVGFTTEPVDSRSTRFASDLAKGFEMPIIHVNADDPEACVIAMRIAVAYRTTFGRDFLIDLVGYRRHGHNEGDEPAYTQPLTYAEVKTKEPVWRAYSATLEAEGVLTSESVAEAQASYRRLFAEAGERVAQKQASDAMPRAGLGSDTCRATRARKDLLVSIAERLVAFPSSFSPHPKLAKILEKRVEAVKSGEGIEWGVAEALAFGSLIQDGVGVRLSGQDCRRGTFSQRHLVLDDFERGSSWSPLEAL
ncbi:MAG: 2-oxoglutarate dehydrogenase E1 component, partial [Gemmatimonadaceae bacterium]|nr:2-oxoglutarate dehydrogenase E1 component [Gemmatimonadaceae bacterium]